MNKTLFEVKAREEQAKKHMRRATESIEEGGTS